MIKSFDFVMSCINFCSLDKEGEENWHANNVKDNSE